MDRRKFVGGVLGGFLAASVDALAQQQPRTTPRIGFLDSESATNQSQRLEALRGGLRELGYVEGRNIVIEVLLPINSTFRFNNSGCATPRGSTTSS